MKIRAASLFFLLASLSMPHPQAATEPQPGWTTSSCAELDGQLAELEPLTYASRSGFYDDPAHAAAIWGGVLWTPAWGYLGYSGLMQAREQRRMERARAQISELRQMKARQRCYEYH